MPSAVPPAIRRNGAAFGAETPEIVNGITRRALLKFRRLLMGESPVLCVSGFHHPALSFNACSTQDSPITAFAYHWNSSTSELILQEKFQ